MRYSRLTLLPITFQNIYERGSIKNKVMIKIGCLYIKYGESRIWYVREVNLELY